MSARASAAEAAPVRVLAHHRGQQRSDERDASRSQRELASSQRDVVVTSSALPPRALDAEAAGVYIAERLGLTQPLTRQRVWWLLRSGHLQSVRIGRRVFTTTQLVDAFIANGGSPRGANDA